MIVRDSFPRGSKDYAFGATVAFKVGWMSDGKLTLVALTDGMTLVFRDMEALLKHLNEDEDGFRPIEPGELVEIIKTQGNRFST